MNPIAMSLAQARFQAALKPGSSVVPVALGQLLTQLSTDSAARTFDAELIGNSTANEFPFLSAMLALGRPPDAAASAAWETAIRWMLNSLRNWSSTEEGSLVKLGALLAAVTALDANLAGLASVSAQLGSNQLTEGLRRILESAKPDLGPGFRRSPELRRQIESVASEGNFEKLGDMVAQLLIFPAPDLWAAVVIVYNSDPAVLAAIIDERNDIPFSLAICTILESQALVLASRVNNLVFKFVSVAHLEQNLSTASNQSPQSNLEAVLVQVGQSSVSAWAAWMRALFRYPTRNSILNDALAEVLPKVSAEHWTLFFKALSLKSSRRAAAPVANMLIPFANSGDKAEAALRWASAYRVWSEWNYGKLEKDWAMFAPVASALDFPVAMYFASLPDEQRLTEERNLLEAIDTLEEQWFNSATELVTERCRLQSRLRLVQHGLAIANGSSSEALPPDIQPDADPYARTRYHYHDVNIF
ncbi:hypothetical protein [Variovorax gossypii]